LLHNAIQHYHELLTPNTAADSQAQLSTAQQQRGLAFGERPLCTVLRPRFLTHDQYRFLCRRVGMVLKAFDKAYRAALADATFRKQFLLLPEEEELVQHDPGFRSCSPTGRLDGFFVSEQDFRFTEYNAETPAGAAYTDCLAEVYLGLPITREFLRTYHVWPISARCGVVHALVDSFQQWSRRREAPRIAILDWKEVPTYNEFVLFEQYFKSHGLPCVIADPGEVEYRGGKLYAGDFHITQIYKRVLIGELLAKGGLTHPVVRAARDNAVCMVNPFRCKILYKKASFAVLSDERNAHLFDGEDREAIAAHIPWTRVVARRKTVHRGQRIDLVPYIHQHREHLVLKPNDDYGGRGIFLGWTVDGQVWEKAVQTALAQPYIVQERINLPSEPFPSYDGGQVQILDRMLDTAPFTFYGAYMDGCLTRISTAALLNVTAGGGSTVPTFLVERR
jgi:hypothetical protein